MWAFNDEGVARAVAASAIPVISAVGHETDFTICDFAADKRAPTPSAAAELAVPETTELKRKISNIITRESDVISHMLKLRREKLDSLARSRVMTDPENLINDRRMYTDMLSDRLTRAFTTELNSKKAEMAAAAGKLSALNPMSVISRGYSAVYKSSGKLVKSVNDVSVGDKIEFKTIGGSVGCTVDEVMPDGDEYRSRENKMEEKQEMSFETAVARLEEIVRMLESGNAPLDKALAAFEEGVSLVKLCNSRLDTAEQKVKILTLGENGKLVETDMEKNKNG